MSTAPVRLRMAEQVRDPVSYRWIALIAVMLGTILEVLDTSIVNVAIPDMMGNLGATLSQVSWVSTGYIIANVIVLPITGWLSLRFGRKRYLATSILLFTVASFFCGTARTLDALVFFRVLQGAGGAALLSTAQATLLEIFPAEQHGTVAGIFGIGVMVGPTLGPTLGGWITDNYSWPWIFFINIPIGLLATILTVLFVRDSAARQERSRHVDFIGFGLLAVGLGCLQTLLEEGNREGWFESAFIQRLAVAGIFGTMLFIYWELRIDNPVINLRVLRNRGLAAGVAFALVLGFGLYGSIFLLPVFLQTIRQYSAWQTGWMLFPSGIATAFAMPFAGKLVSRVPTRNVAAVGTFLFVMGMYMLRGLTMETGSEHLLAALLLRGAAMGFLFVPACLAALAGLEGKDLADGAGLFNLARQFGGSAGIAFLSTFIDRRTVFHRAIVSENVHVFNPLLQVRVSTLETVFRMQGAATSVARNQAIAVLDNTVRRQAALIAFSDAFLMLGLCFLATLPLLIFFKKSRATTGLAHIE